MFFRGTADKMVYLGAQMELWDQPQHKYTGIKYLGIIFQVPEAVESSEVLQNRL